MRDSSNEHRVESRQGQIMVVDIDVEKNIDTAFL